MQGKTTLVIAHRLSTVESADCIIVLKDGRVSEQGSYEDLVEQKGAFYHKER